MVATFHQKANVFLYDSTKNAVDTKGTGMLGWLFYTNEIFDILRKLDVDVCLVETNGTFKQTTLNEVENAFKKMNYKGC